MQCSKLWGVRLCEGGQGVVAGTQHEGVGGGGGVAE